MHTEVEEALLARLHTDGALRDAVVNLETEVAAGRRSPTGAAGEIIQALEKPTSA